MINLSDYYSAGYFLTRNDKPGWHQLKTNLLPEKLISLSRCICPRLSVAWGWTPGDRQAALDFGIPQDKLDEFLHWCGSEYETDLDVFSMFYSTDAARRFIRRFLPDSTNLKIIGVGLPKDLAEKNWSDEEVPRGGGVEERIKKELSIEMGGKTLGFEVVTYWYNDFGDSWLCSLLYEKMYRLFGIRPNQYGLLDTAEDARKVYEWIAEEEMKKGAWREPFDFWLLVSYPLETPYF